MKKIVSLVLALMLILSVLPACAEGFENYKSDFTEGTDGWYARGTGSAKVSVNEGVLTITGRDADWNSPGKDFALNAGREYSIQLYLRQNDVSSARFIVSCAHTKDGTETYENIFKGKVKQDAWVKFTGKYIPDAYDSYTIYIETENAAEISFDIRDFTIKEAAVPYPEDIPSIKEVYASYFPVGTAITQSETRDAKRMNFMARQFAIATPGNELKPDSVLDVAACKKLAETDETAVAVHFDAAKPMLDYCRDNGVAVHGHTLLWHNQTPEALFHEGYDSNKPYCSREVMIARMENYIKATLEGLEELYPGLIVSFDVVNEAIDDNTGKLRDCNWKKTVGEDYLNLAFGFARKYARPGMVLCYNDYSVPYQPKLTGITELLKSLIADGTVDCMGFQSHYQVNTPNIIQIEQAFQQILSLGVKLRVSELDITVTAARDAQFAAQAGRYRQLFDLYMKYADDLLAVQFWGITDDQSWLNTEYPLIFGMNGKPKAAFNTLVKLP